MIKLSGDYLEGGGQIIRTALALSTITQKPFEVDNIRKGRKDSGLKNQHLHCISSLQELCNADVDGAELGSLYLKYYPNKIQAKTLNIDIGTAGSITLLLQSLLLPCFFADKKIKLEITGGTDVKWSMPFDYLNNIFIPQIKKFVDKIDIKLEKRGFYPKGNGKVTITINPKYKLKDFDYNFKKFYDFLKNGKLINNKKSLNKNIKNNNYNNQLNNKQVNNNLKIISNKINNENNNKNIDNNINLTEQGHLIKINGISHASKLLENAKVAERQANAAELILKQLNCPTDIRKEYSETLSTGSVITLWATFSKTKDDIDINKPIILGADSLGEKGKKAEKVGEEAAQKLIREINSKAPVDEHLADNLIPFLTLFSGKIKTSKISNHTLTNIYVCEKFLETKFNINENIIEL